MGKIVESLKKSTQKSSLQHLSEMSFGEKIEKYYVMSDKNGDKFLDLRNEGRYPVPIYSKKIQDLKFEYFYIMIN